MKEINIKGAIGVTSSGYKAAIRLIESGRVPMERMHTHDFDARRCIARDPHARASGARRRVDSLLSDSPTLKQVRKTRHAMKYGLILTRSDIKGQIDAAVRAEAAGFESVWTIEFFNANGLVRLAAVAAATQRVKLGTGIAYAFMRSPMLAASAAMDIDELSGGRMILGLGSGTKTMNENWYSMPFNDPPAPRMKDAIGLIRAAFARAERRRAFVRRRLLPREDSAVLAARHRAPRRFRSRSPPSIAA